MISARYLPALAALLVLAAVPTVLHGYLSRSPSDGRSAAALPLRLNGLEARPSERPLHWVPAAFATSDFIERKYGPDLMLFVARSVDAKRLYHHPEHAVAHGDGYERAFVVRAPDRPDVALHVLKGESDRLSVYALLYGDAFIDDPVRFQLRNAPVLLVRRRGLMTLFFVRGGTGTTPHPPGRSPAERLLLAAVDSFTAQPRTHSP